MKPQTLNNKTQHGFTLIETCVAMLVMMIAALACASLFVFSVQNNVGGSERALAMAVGQQQMEKLRSVNFDDASMNAGTNTTTVKSGERDYTVQIVVANETNADASNKQLKRITVNVTPQDGGASNWTRSTVTLVSMRSTLTFGDYLID
ncbi:MAG TPA: prepilin-type N-terminal cleavage/methylation domain-containing protein [Pyrinomonadaceae bacterium]|nr:prepilin-type N-terminal cleavage/methylation domain-containing protein [Pyrinomonadaceae bacterium]